MTPESDHHPDLSVVIPALNEAAALPPLLSALNAQRDVDIEVLVADGGSSDNSRQVAEAAGARVVTTEAGRAKQMNAAAQAARGSWLLFLHADSTIDDPALLADARSALRDATSGSSDDQPVAGHFPLHFLPRSRRIRYRYLERKTRLNRPGTINGDQGLLIAREHFDALGGFDESLPFFEDQRIAARIFDSGRWIVLPGRLGTAARRFETEGFHRRYTLMAIIMCLHAIRLDAFFERAPGLYRAQHATDRLLISRFIDLARDILADMGWRQRFATWTAVGGYVRKNAWQSALLLDTALRSADHDVPTEPRLLKIFDRAIAPLLANRLVDTLVGQAVRFWVMGLTRHWYRWRDRQWLRQNASAP